ncbi:MAG: serine/threonine-protein phosphatase [Bradyrhizobium sp.]|uniref:PP2C family protein-serine/threonine phosphatase n=1 Tax=Bradyrhizobium sp. TaxID=376 RepID=UPI001DB97DF4|nr:protein phosphatase 2C domain-containing protein [Bradyrhizobium sp.]MBV9561783.1 serine/threonine-protein phosphatase [Bradyrhizobium sp.]
MEVPPLSFDVGSATHAGKVRERNEDSCLVRTDTGLWAVADGMGGHEAGELASRILVESLDTIEQPAAARDLLEQCESRIFRANQEIMALSRSRRGATIGTTAAVLLIRDRHYACVWAGDSRVYLIKRGAIRQLSRDHTELEELVAAGALSRQDAANWPNNVITRAVGVAEDLELEVVTGSVDPGDVFVICSDGLTRHLRNEEILQYASDRNARAACEQMLALALDRGGLDNVTVVIVRLLAAALRSCEPTNTPATRASGVWRS